MTARTTLITWIFLSPAPVRIDVEGVLLLLRGSGVAAGGGCRCDRDRSGGGDAPLLLDRVLELDELEHGHLAERVEHALHIGGHSYSSSSCFGLIGFVGLFWV